MRKFVIILFGASLSIHAVAQWQPINSSGTDIGNIYHMGGNVGIGTAIPNGQLQVTGLSGWDKSTRVYITNGASDYGRTNLILTGRMQSGNDQWIFGSDSRSSIVFSSNYATSGQSVGATGAEQFSIQHEQNSNSLGFLSQTKGNSPLLMMTQSGNIGIGTTNPTSEVQVNDSYQKISLGKLSPQIGQSLGWAAQYIGLNLARNSTGWIANYDGGHNGGSAILGDTFGQFRIVNIPSSGTTGQSLTDSQINQNTNFIINALGYVGIGTPSPDAKLAVKGQVHAQEVKVDLNGAVAPDYVFEKDYKLTSLEEIKTYIDQNKHLPEVPSAKEMEKNGVQLGEMNMLLLKKIEELTLLLIKVSEDKDKQVNELKKEIVALGNK